MVARDGDEDSALLSRDTEFLSSRRRGEKEDDRGKGSRGAERKVRERQIEKERMKGEGKRSIYLRIAADIMLICERGCTPDKPPVCACTYLDI